MHESAAVDPPAQASGRDMPRVAVAANSRSAKGTLDPKPEDSTGAAAASTAAAAAIAASSTSQDNSTLESTSGSPAEPPSDLALPSPSGEENAKTPSASEIALVMGPLCLSVTLSALDLTIVTPAIPAIVASFQSVAGYIWVGSAFILAYTAITPVWGSVADIWGRKPIMLLALAIFLAGSLLCALAPTIESLIAGRAFQGLGACGMSMMVNVIICDMFSLRDRAMYLAITSIVWAVASAVGPVIGGLFTTQLSWRWCFWINLPIGAFVFIVLFFFLDVPTSNTPVLAGLKAIDWSGSILIIGGALMVMLGLDFGNVTFPWSSVTVISLIVFGIVTIGVFLLNEWKLAANPVIPLRLFSTGSTVAAFGVSALNFYVFIGLTYYLPLYSQSVLGVDALTSGAYLLPLVISSCLASAFSGIFIQKTGKYLPLMHVGQLTLVLGIGLFLNLKFEKDLTRLFIYQILAGIGVGMNIEGPILAAQAAATALDTAAVLATLGFVRNIATATSVVLGGVIFQNEMNAANSRLVDTLGQQLASHFNGANATANIEFISTLPAGQQTVVREVYFGASRTVWIMYVAFAGASVVLNFFVRGHHLSKENKGAVLGVDRRIGETAESVQQNQALANGTAIELTTPNAVSVVQEGAGER